MRGGTGIQRQCCVQAPQAVRADQGQIGCLAELLHTMAQHRALTASSPPRRPPAPSATSGRSAAMPSAPARQPPPSEPPNSRRATVAANPPRQSKKTQPASLHISDDDSNRLPRQNPGSIGAKKPAARIERQPASSPIPTQSPIGTGSPQQVTPPRPKKRPKTPHQEVRATLSTRPKPSVAALNTTAPSSRPASAVVPPASAYPRRIVGPRAPGIFDNSKLQLPGYEDISDHPQRFIASAP